MYYKLYLSLSLKYKVSTVLHAVAQPKGATGHFAPLGSSAIRQALGRECIVVHIKIKGKMVMYKYRVDKIQILLGYLY